MTGYSFKPGVAYKFTPCMRDVKSFVAVVADRRDGGRWSVEFVLPKNVISGEVMVMDGRELVKVNVGGVDFCASAAAPMDMSASFALLDQIRESSQGSVR